MRYELILEIKSLSDKKEQEKWIINNRKDGFWYGIDSETEMIIDVIPFQEYPEDQIGYTLKNDQELSAILDLIRKVKLVFTKIGMKQPDSAYLNSPLWDDVVEAAKHAYEVLMKDEDLDALLEAEEKRIVE
jgi:hypothetical protein